MKTKLFFILIFLNILLIGLLFFPSTPSILADTIPCNILPNRQIRLASGILTIGNNNILDRFSFFNPLVAPTPYCIAGPEARIGSSTLEILSGGYDNLKTRYFTNLKNNATTIYEKMSGPGGTQSASNIVKLMNNNIIYELYEVNGDFYVADITKSISMNKPKVVVVFVDGNLTIGVPGGEVNVIQNFTSQDGIIFIVKGNVNILSAVTQVDAFIVTFGEFCSSLTDINDPSSCATYDNPLIINGSVISLGSTTPKFMRKNGNNDNTHPGEIINYQPKYLAIARNIFGEELSYWTEIQ